MGKLNDVRKEYVDWATDRRERSLREEMGGSPSWEDSDDDAVSILWHLGEIMGWDADIDEHPWVGDEPPADGPLCGWQTEYGAGRGSRFCARVATGLCDEHEADRRANYPRPDDGPRFGCEECDHTGLHRPLLDEVESDVVTVEQHDECDVFGSDLLAAQFVALCHPRFRWIVYVAHGVGAYEGINLVKIVDAHGPLADDLPARQYGTHFYLCATDDALVRVGTDLARGREVTR